MWSHAPVQVMVVEDYEDFREALCAMLVCESYHPISCRTAESAWTKLVAGLRPAAIVLDLALPSMSGRELLRLMRGTLSGATIPVFLLSGWQRLDEFAIDADRVLPKNAEPVTIMRAVDRLVVQGRRPPVLDVGQPTADRTEQSGGPIPVLASQGSRPHVANVGPPVAT